ncbi:MAG: cytochrome c biogenesis CcdA family protein [Dehalococcoidia bacterium]
MQIGGINLLVAFLAGLVSCISPCVLPLAPIYVGNLAGGFSGVGGVNRRAPLIHGAAFMAGFTLLFILVGVSAGFAGYILRDQLPLLEKLGGVFVILMGLHMSRILELAPLYRGFGLDWGARVGSGYLRSFLTGSSISAGWLPCIGPTLGAILTLALTSGAVLQSSILLLVYSLGLAVPFVAIGLTLSRTPAALRWLSRHHDAITSVSGIVLILMGIVLFTGMLPRLNAYFRLSSSGLGARI